jgi:hypothetical protein
MVELVAGADIGGLWSIVLGIFLASAAGLERRQTELTETLRDVRVADVMTSQPPRAPASLTVDTFVLAALGESSSSTWLTTGPAGILTGVLGVERLRGIRGAARTSSRLEGVAVPIDEMPATDRGELIIDLLARLDSALPPRAVVRDGDEIVGLVTPEDVARAVRMGQLRGSGQSGSPRGTRTAADRDPNEGPVLP